MDDQGGTPAFYGNAESDFWITESLKVLAVAIHNTRFYIGDPGKVDQVDELLEVIGEIPPLVRQRVLSANGTRRLGFMVERANQIMRDIEQGRGRTPAKPTFRTSIARLMAFATGSRGDARGMQKGGRRVALRMQYVADRTGKGIMAPDLMKAGS